MTDTLDLQLKQIDEAAKLAFDNNDYFTQILDTIISITLNQPLIKANNKLHLSCLNFIYKSFVLKKIESFEIRLKNSLKLVKVLSKFLINDEIKINSEKINYLLIEKSIEIFASVYDLLFLYLVKNPNNKSTWLEITNLKEFLIPKLNTSYPLLPLNKELDLQRSIGCKIAIIKLIAKIIKTQLPSSYSSLSENDTEISDISILLVNSDHPFLYNSNLNSQAQVLIDYLFNFFNNKYLLSTSIFATLSTVLLSLFKLRPNFISNKLLNFILAYESKFKNESKFESNHLKVKLIKRFNDRIDKVLMSMLLNRGFIDKDLPLKSRFNNKLNYFVEKSNKQKKRGILNLDNEDSDDEDNDQRIKRRKVETNTNEPEENIDFYDESKVVKRENFKSLYTLINPKDELSNFDISTISNDILNNLIVLGLANVDKNKLNKALDIVSARYTDLSKRFKQREKEREDEKLKSKLMSKTSKPGTELAQTHNSKEVHIIDEDDDEQDYDPTSPTSSASAKSAANSVVKSEHQVKLENDNYDLEVESKNFELPVPKILDPNEKKEQLKLIIDNFIKSSLTEKKQGIKFLTRLATRGTNLNPEISEYIREAIFNYFKLDIKGKIDNVIEWLNEEYYNEFIIMKMDMEKDAEKSNYLKYSNLTVDYLIPFLEPSDRNLFIRLLSEVPYLNYEMVSKLKSICNDPVRFKIGFQPLLYLIMFRPPVFNDCIKFLVEMYIEADNKGNEQLKTECLNYLQKYKPDAVPKKEATLQSVSV